MPDFIPAPQLPTGLAEEAIRQRANRPNPWMALVQGFAPYAEMYGKGKLENALSLQRQTATAKLNSMPSDQLQKILTQLRSGGGGGIGLGGGGPATAGATPASTGWSPDVHPSIPQTWSSFSEGWE